MNRKTLGEWHLVNEENPPQDRVGGCLVPDERRPFENDKREGDFIPTKNPQNPYLKNK
jgi:hypothetical protein